MTTNQPIDMESHKQLSDFVSSYFDALTETDGVTYWLASQGVRESGLRIDGAALRLGQRHKLSFTLQELSGELLSFGGLLPMAYDVRIKLDGKKVVGELDEGIAWPKDGKPHNVEWVFILVKQLEPMTNNHVYILPNRSSDRPCDLPMYTAKLTNLTLDIVSPT